LCRHPPDARLAKAPIRRKALTLFRPTSIDQVQIHILSVGDKLPAWADSAVQEYLKRMPKELGVKLQEIRPAARAAGKPIATLLKQEAARLEAALPAASLKVLLDERGARWSSAQLAARLKDWLQHQSSVAFLIGGADGVSAEIRAAADIELSLSSFTLPHALARVLIVEQLYRAASILKGHPYHRA
jgi:23S rRNA (pseudouridine1915-N3)-methyltransferase